MKVFVKINVLKIISGHFDTLINANTKKHEFDDFLTFFLVPLVAAVLMLFCKVDLNDLAKNIIITSVTILIGLLFNVIVIIFDIIKRNARKKEKNKALAEVLTNISYSILVALLIIVSTLSTAFKTPWMHCLATGLVIFLLWHYFLTVLMIMKRLYHVFINEINEIDQTENDKEKSTEI